jgi:hypothetical protein
LTATRRTPAPPLAAPGHRCHAIGCEKEIDPKLLMCFPHWKLVPKFLQKQIWKWYRPGQEIDKRPSREYMAVQRLAIDAVAVLERR